jgi:hypothetical protein
MCVKQHYYHHVRRSKESICVFRSLPCQLPCKNRGGLRSEVHFANGASEGTRLYTAFMNGSLCDIFCL